VPGAIAIGLMHGRRPPMGDALLLEEGKQTVVVLKKIE
jgi:hypothetical protein